MPLVAMASSLLSEEQVCAAVYQKQEAFMRTYYVFQAVNSPDLRGFTDRLPGASLPSDLGPWALVQEIEPNQEWKLAISRAVVAAGILENGFYLWGPIERTDASHPTIASDRVEGTAVFGRDNEQIGTIKRLFIEKVSGRVTYVDVSFGGFLGMGSRHVTIPWEKLTYDKELEGYRTDLVEDQVRAASTATGTDALPQAGSVSGV